jgi:hypothetical protein
MGIFNNIYSQGCGETHNGVIEVEKKIAKKDEVKDSLVSLALCGKK